jgi:hypothetical protein
LARTVARCERGGLFYLTGGDPGLVVDVLRESPVWRAIAGDRAVYQPGTHVHEIPVWLVNGQRHKPLGCEAAVGQESITKSCCPPGRVVSPRGNEYRRVGVFKEGSLSE